MYTPHKLTPGPVATSCLTCKRRHKKCDRRKPTCERCSKGGYECLGYGHNKRDVPIQDESPRLSDADVKVPGSDSSGSSLPASTPSKPSSSRDGSPRIKEHILRDEAVVSEPARTNPGDPGTIVPYDNKDDDFIYDTFPPQSRSRFQLLKRGRSQPTITHSTAAASSPSSSSPSSRLFFGGRIPRSVSVTPSDIQQTMEYVVSQFDRLMQLSYFKPQPQDLVIFHEQTLQRMATCSFSREAMLLDAKVHESILNGSTSDLRDELTRWAENFEGQLRSRMCQSLTSYELRERLGNTLEVSFLKSILLSSSNTYRLLRHATPIFLQTIFSDSTLWPSQHNPALVSIAHLLASPRYEPAHFVLMDALCALVYAVPQLVEYNVDIEPFHTNPHPIEWIHGFPAEFQILLAKVNACRDQGLLDDWKQIECRLMSWQVRLSYQPPVLESWKHVAWLAVQESWRQTLLIYLYLSVCGVSSDDARIQSSVRQIFQLVGAIRRQDPPASNVHYFAQYLIAGACTRSEKQRALVRKRLSCASETRFWLLRAPDFVPVLNHLWSGAAAGGRPIKWRDYLHSREAALPLSA